MPTDVVTAFCRHGGEILLLRRSEDVGTYTGQWGGVSGFAEGDPDEQVLVEIEEETGLSRDRVDLVRSGRPVEFHDETLDRRWAVHPYLFDCETRDLTTSEEHVAAEWVPATEMLRRECVPELWTAYERVAPTARSIAADGTHGAAYLSIRALEVLRDRAGLVATEGGSMDELADLARRLVQVRPSMAVLANRVNRVLANAADPEGVERGAIAAIADAVEADHAAAANAADVADDATVLTLSRSGTVLEALRTVDPAAVYVAESRPSCEGVGVAEAIADDCPVVLHTDAAIAQVLSSRDVDCVLVGADTVLPDGRVVNKTGTRGTAIAARYEDVPVFAVAAADKVTTADDVSLESGDAAALYDGDAPLDAYNPTFDVTPADCVAGVVTDRGTLDVADVRSVAAEHRENEDW